VKNRKTHRRGGGTKEYQKKEETEENREERDQKTSRERDEDTEIKLRRQTPTKNRREKAKIDESTDRPASTPSTSSSSLRFRL
jgi:hypothetical protein